MSQSETPTHRLEKACYLEHASDVLDFEATADMKHARIWFQQIFKDFGAFEESPWLPLDIARSGRTIANLAQRIAEHSPNQEASTKNAQTIHTLATSAFALFDPMQPLSTDGYLNFVPLGINQPVQIGRSDSAVFGALESDTVSENHFIVNVNEDDTLQVQASDIDNALRLEVLAAAAEQGTVRGMIYPMKDYLVPHSLRGASHLSPAQMVETFKGGKVFPKAPSAQVTVESMSPELFMSEDQLVSSLRNIGSRAFAATLKHS